MDNQDWKSQLGAAFGIDLQQPASEAPAEPEKKETAQEQQGKKMIDIILDKKGRNGKKATIVANLQLDDETLKELAAALKRACAVGGSARGNEILIQGDKRQEVLNFLKQQGFKARII